MRISVVDAEHCISTYYLPNLISIRLDNERTFYDNDDYIYSFCVSGKPLTKSVSLGHYPSREQKSRRTKLQIKALLFRWIESPPPELGYLAEKMLATGMLNPAGDLGNVWPIEFVNKRELHVIKLPTVSHEEVRTAMLQLIGNYLELQEHEIEPFFDMHG